MGGRYAYCGVVHFLSVLYKLTGHLSFVSLTELNILCAVIPWALVVC